MQRRRHMRSNRGNVLVLAVAIFVGIVMAISLFSMSFTRMVGSHQEHKTAIEASALAAADDLSRIVIEDPNFGFLGLSDSPPIESGTMAADHFFTKVQGINTLFARIRLDMIIADQLHNQLMKQILDTEYQEARQAATRLSNTLVSACLPGGSGPGADGSTIRPYADAEQAYLSNSIRMNGGQSNLKSGSFKITLGMATGLNTNTPTPNPQSAASLNSNTMQENGNYEAFIDVPYDGYDFVFSGGDVTALVDLKAFSVSSQQLPYYVANIVKCEADEITQYKNEYAQTDSATLHIAACAQPAAVLDPMPNESALAVRFSPGTFPNFQRLGDLLDTTCIEYSPADSVGTPLNGDYPQNSLTPLVLADAADTNPPFGQVVTMALYDWIKNQGVNVNVTSLMQCFNQPMNNSIPANIPQVHYFRATTGGVITETEQIDDPTLALPVSQNQYLAESGAIILGSGTSINTNNMILYDMFVRDFVYKQGRLKGGLHAGEPFGILGPTIANTIPNTPMGENPTRYALFPTGPGGGAVRPTYLKMGTAVEIRFRGRS